MNWSFLILKNLENMNQHFNVKPIEQSYNNLENECDLIEIEEEITSQKVKESLNFSNKLRTDKGKVQNASVLMTQLNPQR